LFFLPPYAPDLNPDELVWGHVKGRIGRRTVTTKKELKKQAWSALRSLQKWPSKIRGFFRHPSCQYAQMG
jgi:transposase